MSQSTGSRSLPSRLVIAAFEGWNDAGNAASSALEHLINMWHAKEIAELDAEQYYDFQVARPFTTTDITGQRHLSWPTTQVFSGHIEQEHEEVLLIQGLEPSMRWPSYCRELLRIIKTADAGSLIILGALLADVPHTRSIPVSSTSNDPELRQKLGIEASEYEGPTGIVGVLDSFALSAGIPSVSVWAAAPHYVAHPPSPKATMALLNELSSLTEVPIALGDLPDEARAWQEGVDELAAEDPDIAEYVEQLEKSKDAVDSPDATGEAIAREFERYLRGHDEGKNRPRSA